MQTRKPFLHFFLIVLVFSFSTAALRADRVVLKSGATLEGEILSENAYEVKMEVSRNQDGTIRTIKVIDQKLIESMSRGQPVRNVTDQISATPEPVATISRPMRLREAELTASTVRVAVAIRLPCRMTPT